jgi:hypothetical protein
MTGYNFTPNNVDKIITLEKSKALDESNIIEDFIFEIDTKNFILDLNHVAEYKQGVRVIWQYNKNWDKMQSNLQNKCKKKGVKEEHISLIEDTVDLNYNTVTNSQEKYDIPVENKQQQDQVDQETDNDEAESISLPQKLVELALNNCMLFKDEFGIPYALVKIDDYYDVLPVERTKFKRYVSKLYYDANDGRIAYPEAIKTAVAQLEAKAEFEGKTIALYLRVAWSNTATTKDAIYYDLSDSKRRCIKITDNSWNIVDNQIEVLFRRYRHLSPQIEPINVLSNNDDDNMDDNIDNTDNTILDKFIDLLNVKDDDNKLLLKCYIISLFIPEISKPILMLHGEQGSAKSSLQELIKILVDPSSIKTLTFPRDTNEFIQQLSHNYVAVYDNISDIKDWISDLLCRAVTGNSFSKRSLYTDDDDFFYNFKRVVGLNGINLGATKADLLDRGLIIQLERIPKENRKKVEDIWKEFDELKPKLLGYIFDILVKVLYFKSENPNFTLQGALNRMADWEEYAEIISRSIGNTEGEFQRVYQNNIGIQIDEAIAASPLSQAIMELMNDKNDELTKTPTDLHSELETIAITKLNMNTAKIKSWPKSPSYLSRRLNGIKTNLREKGIEITIGNKDSQDKRLITICKVPSVASMPSKTDKSSTNQSQKIDGTENIDKVPSKVPSTNTSENQAQNPSLDSIDSIDGTLQTLLPCHYCNYKFNSEKELLVHSLNTHPVKPAQPDETITRLENNEKKEVKK